MKVRASIRSLAKQPGSKVVRRRGHTYVTTRRTPASRPVRAKRLREAKEHGSSGTGT